jgi:competence protein ComEA
MRLDPAPDLDSDDIAALRAAAAGSVPARRASLLGYWRAWLPILMRATATGLALLGLAGIGLAARGSSQLPALAHVPLAFGMAQMLGAAPLAAGARVARPAAVASDVGPRDVGLGEAGLSEAGLSSGAVPKCSCDAPGPCAPSLAPAAPSATPHAAGTADAASDVAGAVLADGRVILNLAGALELQRLPGIGAKRAAAILELRRRVGRFRRTSDLLRVKGIGRRTLERLSPQLLLDAPSRPGAASAAP